MRLLNPCYSCGLELWRLDKLLVESGIDEADERRDEELRRLTTPNVVHSVRASCIARQKPRALPARHSGTDLGYLLLFAMILQLRCGCARDCTWSHR